MGAGGLALSRIASDDCHVTTETQQLEEEELQEEAAGSFYGAEEDGCSDHKKAAGSGESRFPFHAPGSLMGPPIQLGD